MLKEHDFYIVPVVNPDGEPYPKSRQHRTDRIPTCPTLLRAAYHTSRPSRRSLLTSQRYGPHTAGGPQLAV